MIREVSIVVTRVYDITDEDGRATGIRDRNGLFHWEAADPTTMLSRRILDEGGYETRFPYERKVAP